MFIKSEIKIIDNIGTKDCFFCKVCGFPLNTFDDFKSLREYDCCNECYLTYAQCRRKDWKEGWRPEQTDLEEYIYMRKQIKSARSKK